jgi:hypothetical protein
MLWACLWAVIYFGGVIRYAFEMRAAGTETWFRAFFAASVWPVMAPYCLWLDYQDWLEAQEEEEGDDDDGDDDDDDGGTPLTSDSPAARVPA